MGCDTIVEGGFAGLILTGAVSLRHEDEQALTGPRQENAAAFLC